MITPYHISEHGALYHGDCLDILPTLADKSVDMVLTDPPYGIDFLSNWTDNHFKIANDDLCSWTEQLPLWLAEMKRVLTDTGCCCCCCGGGGGKTPVTALFTIEFIKHFHLIQTLIWDKLTIGLGWHYRPSYETIVIGSKSKDKYAFYDETKSLSNIIKINNVIPQRGEHPTVKPVSLMAKLLFIHSQKNDLILDPFAGSGTTGIACIRTNRRYVMIEKEEKYCEIAAKRIDTELDQTDFLREL